MTDLTFLLQTILDGLVTGALIALVALGLTLVFGIARFVHVAHADLLTVAAYMTLLAEPHLGFGLAAVLGVAITVALSLLIHRTVYRRLVGGPSISLVIASLGVALALRYLVVFLWGTGQHAFGLPIRRALWFGPFRIAPYELMIVATVVALMVAVYLVLRLTSVGRDMRAVADNPNLARVCGISPERVITWMWVLAAGLAGVAGVLVGVQTVITPYMGWHLLIPAFAAAVLGGVGHPFGTVVGALIIGVTQELAALYWMPTYKLAAAFLVMTIMLLIRPSGLFGAREVAR